MCVCVCVFVCVCDSYVGHGTAGEKLGIQGFLTICPDPQLLHVIDRTDVNLLFVWHYWNIVSLDLY